MQVKFTEDGYGETKQLNEVVESSNELKSFLINYVGEKSNPDNGEVTVDHIVNVMSEDFPEFLMAVAEENWIRGYEQAMTDVEEGEKIFDEFTKDQKESDSESN
tara:strand:- start:1121 stop:1432 length:312 start_codon:yes stop_codon:yes gene_type:complete